MNSIARQAETKILIIVEEQRHIMLEQLLSRLPELTWNQVFSLVDELRRQKLISLQRRGFEYELRASCLSTLNS